MRIWFDTEFIEDGRTIDLISIGMVREDEQEYYAESAECDLSKADVWVMENVVKKLTGPRKTRLQIASDLVDFCGPNPEFWAYFGAYDWVALCQLYGKMMNLPRNWPMFVRDLRQLCGPVELPKQSTPEHHALNDALWLQFAHRSNWEWNLKKDAA